MNWKEIWKHIREKQKIAHYYFSEQNDTILTSNLHIYKRLSIFSTLIAFLYSLATGLFLHEWRFTPFHCLMFVVLVIHIFISVYINKHRLKSKTLEKALCVLFSLFVFLTLICVDTVVYPDRGQIFSAAFLVVAPCIFIMSTSRMLIDQLFFVVVYAVLAFNFKVHSIALSDMNAIFAGFFFGIILYAITMDLRLQVNAEVIRLKYFSEIDELTRIKNRREANAQISYILEQRGKDSPCALMMLDVDSFKSINDTYGHKVGDQVLVEVAKVLSGSFRKTDVVSRFGGDEFMVFVSGFSADDFPQKKCQEIQNKVCTIMSDKMSVSCSIGICILTSGHRTMEELICEADKALYESKARQKGTFTVSSIP